MGVIIYPYWDYHVSKKNGPGPMPYVDAHVFMIKVRVSTANQCTDHDVQFLGFQVNHLSPLSWITLWLISKIPIRKCKSGVVDNGLS